MVPPSRFEGRSCHGNEDTTINLTTIRENIATVAGTVSGVRYTYPRGADTIAGTPSVVVGDPAAEVIPGNRMVVNATIPMDLWIEQVSDTARDTKKVDDFVGTFLTTFAANQGLSGAVSYCVITGFDTDRYAELGEARYSGVRFTLFASVHEAVTQGL